MLRFMNKNKNVFHYIPVFFWGILIFFYMPFAQNRDSIESLVSRIDFLNEKIDSVNLEKQTFKRKGQSISEQEKKSALLRDSLQQIRQKIENKVTESPGLNKKHSFSSSIIPQNYFDWIIIITGIMAVFSGIILISGVVKTIRNKPKKKDFRKKTSVTAPKNQNLNSELPAKPLPEFKIPEDSFSSQEIKSSPVTKKWEKPSMNSPEIEKHVLQAFHNGMNIPDISRKFQLSSDYVSLVLKVAKKQ